MTQPVTKLMNPKPEIERIFVVVPNNMEIVATVNRIFEKMDKQVMIAHFDQITRHSGEKSYEINDRLSQQIKEDTDHDVVLLVI